MFAAAPSDAHVHLWADPADVRRHLVFRDWLRSHPDDRALYEYVKRRLVERPWETSNQYADAKTAVVATIMRRANGRRQGPRIERFARTIAEYVPSGARILEIGAGEGLLARELAAAGYEVTALDSELRSTFPIVESSFESYEAAASSFGCAAAQLVLHHARDLCAMLEKVDALVAPGGIVAIDDYGWERSADPVFRAERADLHESGAMLVALRSRFEELRYADHPYLEDGTGNDAIGFTFIGRTRTARMR